MIYSALGTCTKPMECSKILVCSAHGSSRVDCAVVRRSRRIYLIATSGAGHTYILFVVIESFHPQQ